MHRSFLGFFIDVLFDFTYETNIYEAFVFYFFYVFFGYFISGASIYIVAILPFSHFILVLLAPFIFYTFVSVSIIIKKNLKDRYSIYLICYTIALTLFMPLCLAWFSLVWSNPFSANFIQECSMAFRVCFFPELALGCIPVAILTMREDQSLKETIEKLEQEKLENERKIEKQLLTEQAIASKIEEIKKHVNNIEEKEETNEKE